MIKDKCPGCGKEYEWDNCQDTYWGTQEVKVEDSLTREGDTISGRIVTLYVCNCAATVAVLVTDDTGGTVYIPSTKEL